MNVRTNTRHELSQYMLLLDLAMVVMSATATSFFWFLGVDDLGHTFLNAPPHGATSCCLCYGPRYIVYFRCWYVVPVPLSRSFVPSSLLAPHAHAFASHFFSLPLHHPTVHYVLPSAPTRRSIQLGSSNHTFLVLLLFPLCLLFSCYVGLLFLLSIQRAAKVDV